MPDESSTHIKIVRSKRALRPFAMVYGPEVMATDLSDGAFRTLALLDLLCGADFEGHHSVALIARLRRITERSIQNHLAELKEAKRIDVEYRESRTNVITILDPVEVYGVEAISEFYQVVKKTGQDLRAGGENNFTPPRKNLPSLPENNFTPSPKIISPRVDKDGVKGEGVQSPSGSAERNAQSGGPETGGTPGGGIASDVERDAGKGSNSPPAGPPTSAGAGCGLVMPGAASEPRKREKTAKTKALYDPERPVDGWTGRDAVGYFRMKFNEKWPGEGAPDWSIKDFTMVGDRIEWLKTERIGVPMMKRVIDTLFDRWKNGLPSKLGWQSPRPSLILIGSSKLFESIVREIQSGHEVTKKVCRDEYDPVEAAKMPNSGWHKQV